MNEETIITGYHGTDIKNAESICKKNFRINKDKYNKLYLGAGIYFFDNIDNALDWNIKKFKKDFRYKPEWKELIKSYTIIKGIISVKEKDILDLDKKENLYKLELLVTKINKKLESSPEYCRAQNKTAAIINTLYEIKEINKKLIVKTFFEKIETKKFNELKNYPRRMFCVKDVSIISKKLERIDIKEELFKSIIYFYD